MNGFLDEKGIEADDRTEAYAAIRLDSDTTDAGQACRSDLRSGKRLGKRVTEIAGGI